MSRRSQGRSRGYAAIGLWQPKTPANVGAVLRACGCYGAAMCAVQGKRYQKSATDTMQQHRHMPFIQTDDLRGLIPYDCIPIAIEITDDAKPINEFNHPERAFYIFGPEDGSLPGAVLDWCHGKPVYIPTAACMNLAATVNVVLYDRWRQRNA